MKLDLNLDPDKLKKIVVILGAVLAVAIITLIIVTSVMGSKVSEIAAENEQLQLTNEQLQLAGEYQALNDEFVQYENQAQKLANDSILIKYAAAKSKVEKLLQELNSEKKKSAARIKELQSEIETLKGILRHYVAQIDSLGKENAGLKAENKKIKNRNAELTSRVEEATRKNEELSERMTLAEKLNVTGLSLTPLKKNGKTEKKVKKAKQLMVTFTIPQNNSTPVGEKIIYMRITSPEGNLLGDAGTFNFEGASLQCSARKIVEYAGEEISDIKIYWDVNTVLNPGEYLVELFADDYRLASKKFTLKN
jgi:regulator of replication initiation timing